MAEERHDPDSHLDSAPPGWKGTVEHMKKHPEISNPFALAHYMANEGYTPHDAMNKDVLDTAHEMAQASNYADAAFYTTVGAKAGNGNGDPYEAKTENNEPFEEENMSDAAEHEHEDDDEKLLNDSEVESGEHLPTEHAAKAPTDPAVKSVPEGVHSSLSDPAPENFGRDPISVEGEETNDDDDLGDDDDADDHAGEKLF